MAERRVFAGYYKRYDGKPIFVIRVLKDIDTGEAILVCKDASFSREDNEHYYLIRYASFCEQVEVDGIYHGLIPKKELFSGYRVGDEVRVRVTRVRGDGKLDLTTRDKAGSQIFSDSDLVMKVIEEFDGVLPFNDKASPEVIAREFKLSKNAFKRAVGHLLKEGKIEITEKSIRKIDK